MSVKSPNVDDVFAKFINKVSANELEKYFGIKGVKFEKGNISAAESVENVVKSAVFFFRSEATMPKAVAGTLKEYVVDPNKLSKIKFYDFGQKIEQAEWKGDATVPLFNSIQKVNCEKCGGLGYIKCKNCDGLGIIKCKKCGGNGQVECKKCKGTGKQSFKVEVLDEKMKKDKKTLDYQCVECFGSGKVLCDACKGIGKQNCSKCGKDFGKLYCKDCKGVGKNFLYRIGPVPFKSAEKEIVPHLFFQPEFEKKVGDQLSSQITTVNGIFIKDLKDMDEEFVKAQLGYWDGDIRNRMSEAKKVFKDLEKSKGIEVPKFPIYLFPLLKLDVKTPKGKTFNIYSIGTDRGHYVFAPKF